MYYVSLLFPPLTAPQLPPPQHMPLFFIILFISRFKIFLRVKSTEDFIITTAVTIAA